MNPYISILAVCLLMFSHCLNAPASAHVDSASALQQTTDNDTSKISSPVYRSSNFAATRKLLRANLHEVYGWKTIEHVCLETDLNSKTAKPGDIVWGLLDDDCKWGSKLVAARDSLIKGHIVEVGEPRTLFRASLSSDKRYHSDGSISIQFDEIIDQDGQSWPIVGRLCRLFDLKDSSSGRPWLLKVDKNGDAIKGGLTLSETEKSIFLAGRIATAVPIPVGIAINVVGVPAVLGAVGAAYPAFVYNRPVDLKEKGVRSKAFVYGFVSNLPGAFAVAACVQKGSDVLLNAGDQIVVDLTFRDNVFCSRGRLSVTGSVLK